jgi:hypothetical protein
MVAVMHAATMRGSATGRISEIDAELSCGAPAPDIVPSATPMGGSFINQWLSLALHWLGQTPGLTEKLVLRACTYGIISLLAAQT